MSAAAYLQALAKTADAYNPFNLIVFDGHALMGFESRHGRALTLPPGISSVSNADFNTPWPKLLHLHAGVSQALALVDQDAMLEKTLFNLLSNARVASDAELPQTGLSIGRERTLSAAFIRTPDYGTRASSVVRLGKQSAFFTERSFDAAGFKGEVSEHISLA